MRFRGPATAPTSQSRGLQSALVAYLKRLTWRFNRPLVLKSPPHTARIRRLLELSPQAKFVHIHRDPYAVFSSTRRMLTVNVSMHCLQRPPTPHDLDDWIIRQYRAMHDAFFQDRHLIPPGHYHELRFNDLESDPLRQMQRLYQALNLPPLPPVQPTLERYIATLRGYQKNEFPDLPVALRQRIADAWRPCFEQWGYIPDPPPGPRLTPTLPKTGSNSL